MNRDLTFGGTLSQEINYPFCNHFQNLVWLNSVYLNIKLWLDIVKVLETYKVYDLVSCAMMYIVAPRVSALAGCDRVVSEPGYRECEFL